MEGYDYDAAARTVEIEDITSDATNREILRRLKANDPTFTKLQVGNTRDDDKCFCPGGARELGWLGYYIGKNTALKEFHLSSDPFRGFSHNAIDQFCRGMNSNRSIQKIVVYSMNLSGGEIFQSLCPVFEDNNNISHLAVKGCQFGAGCARQIALALRGCNRSLKHIELVFNEMGGEQLLDIIEALSAHPQLEKLELVRGDIGRNECTALANLLRRAELQELNLSGNDIDDEGVDALVGALTNSRLQWLSLSSNNITARGCQSLAAMLERTNSNLETLRLVSNNIGNEGGRTFANALATNHTLKTLDLYRNGITAEGWSSFSKVLCDTSSIYKTFLSNHTLEHLAWVDRNMPVDVNSSLDLNANSEDKKQVAIKKILKHHRHFDMQPFFEWELKVLPIAIEWFERALSIANEYEAQIGKQKLEAIYQFIRAMPEVFEPIPAAAGEKRKRSAVELMGGRLN